jgi:hypothetical protein
MMIPANSYKDVLLALKTSFDRSPSPELHPRVVAILFVPPFTKFAKESLIPRLDYFHRRSGNTIEFFSVGYGGYMQRSAFPDVIDVHAQHTEDGSIIPWGYSNRVFDEMRNKFENLTVWKFSGEVDLLLVTASYDKEKRRVMMDFSNAIVLDLDLILSDNAIRSFGCFFEEFVCYTDHNLHDNTTIDFSDSRALRVMGTSLLDGILDAISKALGLVWKRGLHFREVNLRPDELQKKLLEESTPPVDFSKQSQPKRHTSDQKEGGKGQLLFSIRVFRAIKEQLCLGTGYRPIPLVGLSEMTILRASNSGIRELCGIENCSGLVELHLDLNSIDDLTPLSKLTKLQELYLSGNNISNITPLSSLVDLTNLTLRGNSIMDIGPLRGLTKLLELDLSSNQICNIEPLVDNCRAQGIGKGSKILLYGNQLDKTSVENHLPHLRKMGILVGYERTFRG